MRDPHIVALHYRLETGPQLAFKDPDSVERETAAFSLRLADGQLRVEMKNHYATEVEARLVVRPYLRSWEIVTALQHGPGAMTFTFERAEVIDREPPPPGANRAVVAVVLEDATLTAHAGTHPVTLTKYPDPPNAFKATQDVVAMWERYERYLADRQLLTDLAWWCLTTIEWLSGGRPRAAERYAISENVLKELHRLAHVGDEKTARKRFDGQDLRPHTPAEIAWMEAVIRRIIQRVGEWGAAPDVKWPQITLKDFPSIPGPRRKPKRTHHPRVSGAGRMVPGKRNI